jgi:hypothetical protein
MPNPNMFGPASMVLSQTISSFQSMLPTISSVRKASPDDPDMAGDVRLGEIAASALSIGVGAIASSLLGDPVLISSFIALTLIIIYEQALRRNRPMDPKPQTLKVVQDNGNVTVA